MCGKCCEAIGLRYSPEDLRKYKTNRDAIWILKNWNQITQEDALKINPHLNKWVEKINTKLFFYNCINYDKEKRICKIHKNKPNICADYPFYGRGKIAYDELFYSPSCGYD